MNLQTIANRYKIEQELGRGGMAVVYRALDMRLQRHVALKLLHPFLATQPESAARFLRESEAIAKLHHPNIVEIFDAGVDEDSGSHYLVMELVEGPTLGEFIKAHPTKIPEVGLAMGCCLCDAVEHAHQAGIIHRDIKPENIMISSDGTMKLMDFGIARVLDAERMTASGSLVGSPAHMPPEIIEGQSYSFPCDVFSLGTVIYYMVTNTLPFQGNTPMTVFRAILDNQYQKPSRVLLSVSKSIDNVIARCLNTEPSARYQTAVELKTAMMPIIAPMRFDNYHELLAKYFNDPDSFFEEYLPVVKEVLNASAQHAVSEHRLPAALEKLNCVLAYDPDDPQANALLKKLRMGDLLRRRLMVTAGFVVCLGIVILCVVLIFSERDEPRPIGQLVISHHPSPADTQELSVPDYAGAQISQTALTRYAWNLRPKLDLSQPIADKSGMSADPDEHDRMVGHHENQNALNSEPAVQENHREVSKTLPKTVKKSADSRGQTVSGDSGMGNDNPEPSSDAAEPRVVQPMVHVVQPVFPPDAFAVINGKRYDPNSSGDIVMDLPEGRYKMTLTCAKRCVPQTFSLLADMGQPKTREVISLDWADASLMLSQPENMSVYFVARRLDDRSQRVFHLVSRLPNAVSGFNAFGRPIQLEVYAIPTNITLKSFDINALEKAKFASTRVSLEPGDTRTIKF